MISVRCAANTQCIKLDQIVTSVNTVASFICFEIAEIHCRLTVKFGTDFAALKEKGVKADEKNNIVCYLQKKARYKLRWTPCLCPLLATDKKEVNHDDSNLTNECVFSADFVGARRNY